MTAWRAGSWTAIAAALWSLVFAAFHIIWATGNYVGLDEAEARVAFAKPVTLAYDLVVAATCLIAVLVALALTMPWGRRVPRRLLATLAWTGSALLVLRSAASIVQSVYLLVVGRFTLAVLGFWEPWFYLGATLFVMSTWRWQRTGPPVDSS